MRIASGVTDQYIYFVAVDSTDLKTRETGLTTFTVYRSRNGGAAAAMTTPTINETDTTNMPGVYELLLDEDMTIDAGDETQEMAFHITQASMAPVTRTIELYRPKITAGNTLDVTATGAAGIDWGNIENKTTANDLSGTDIQLVDTCTTNTDMRGTDSAGTAAELAKVPKSDGTTSWNATALAAINAEADTALTDIGLDHLISSALPTNWATDVASGSVFDNIADDGTAAYDRTTDSLQAVRDHVGDGTNLTEAGGTGDQLTGITGVQLAADQAVNATKFGGAAVTATTSVTFPAASTVATTTGAVGSVTGSVGSNLELGPAEVNAEVVDVLKTDTISDLSNGAPPATPTFEEAVMYLYSALRNKIIVNTTGTPDYKEFYNDANTIIWRKEVSDDGNDYTEAEGVAGS